MARGPASRGARFCFCWAVRGAFFFFCFAAGARQVHSLNCCSPPPSIHCRKTSSVRGAFLSLLRVRCELTHSLAACRPEHPQQEKKRAAHPQQKKRAPHTQQKSTHNKKINTPTGFRANGTWHTVRTPKGHKHKHVTGISLPHWASL